MDKMEAFRRTVAQIGNAPAEVISLHLREKYGVTIEPKFIPFFRASLQDRERAARLRQQAQPVGETSKGG